MNIIIFVAEQGKTGARSVVCPISHQHGVSL